MSREDDENDDSNSMDVMLKKSASDTKMDKGHQKLKIFDDEEGDSDSDVDS